MTRRRSVCDEYFVKIARRTRNELAALVPALTGEVRGAELQFTHASLHGIIVAAGRDQSEQSNRPCVARGCRHCAAELIVGPSSGSDIRRPALSREVRCVESEVARISANFLVAALARLESEACEYFDPALRGGDCLEQRSVSPRHSAPARMIEVARVELEVCDPQSHGPVTAPPTTQPELAQDHEVGRGRSDGFAQLVIGPRPLPRHAAVLRFASDNRGLMVSACRTLARAAISACGRRARAARWRGSASPSRASACRGE